MWHVKVFFIRIDRKPVALHTRCVYATQYDDDNEQLLGGQG